ncbi:MAG: pyruvate formate-lyase-activating protein [Mycobacterium leprae]
MALPLPVRPGVPAPDRVGRIHSVESCGAVDGPGLRFVVFVQGCHMRCRYCHNADTWDLRGGGERTVGSLVDEIRRYTPFMKASKGGVTVSGGEPLLQPDFVAGIFEECHKLGIHTALDTNGLQTPQAALPVLEHTDLVLLDIKQINPLKHRDLTKVENRKTLTMARFIADLNIPMWLRYVVVPGHSDAPEDVAALAEFASTLPTVQKVELLPYHKLGKHKWELMGVPYTLDDVEPPTPDVMDRIRAQFTDRGLRVG